MMAKQKNDSSNSILSSIDELLSREPPRTRSRSEQFNIRLLEQKQQANKKDSKIDAQPSERQQQLQKDFPATKALKAAHPNLKYNKVPASIVAAATTAKAVKVNVQPKKKNNIRLLTQEMRIAPEQDGWREKLSLLGLEKEEIRLLMKQVKQDVVAELPQTIPPLVEKFLNQRLDSILSNRSFKKSS